MTLLAALALASEPTYERELEHEGMTFRWSHTQAGLAGQVLAPASGWVAVGFNGPQRLAGTHFVIGSTRAVELHRAEPPRHPKVASIEGQLERQEGQAVLTFLLPNELLELEAGESTWLMLAWSISEDFDHHSRQRVHLAVEL